MVGQIRFENVKKIFHNPDGGTVHALNGIDFEVEAGEFICLIGPSGCGKSTLLRLLAGLDRPTEGKIDLDGEEIKTTGVDRGLVFQDHTLFPWLNIYDNIAFGLRVGKNYKKKKSVVNEMIRLVGLEGFEKSFPHQLSGGMCQRAALARALAVNPKVLLLDEPLGALDAFTRMNMQDELLNIKKKRNTTMIMVTHDVDESIYLSDRIVVMSSRPAKVEEILTVSMPHPRDRNNPEFIRLRNDILKVLRYAGIEKDPEYYI